MQHNTDKLSMGRVSRVSIELDNGDVVELHGNMFCNIDESVDSSNITTNRFSTREIVTDRILTVTVFGVIEGKISRPGRVEESSAPKPLERFIRRRVSL